MGIRIKLPHLNSLIPMADGYAESATLRPIRPYRKYFIAISQAMGGDLFKTALKRMLEESELVI